MHEYTDEQLIEQYNSRDESAVENTAKKYGRYCFSVAFGILKDKRDTEECVNDTWLSAWNSIPPNIPASLKLYLGELTRNLSFNRLKANNSKKRGGGIPPSVLEEAEEMALCTVEVESGVEREAFAALLNGFLRGLPQRERGIFIRRYFYLEEVSSIAKRYGVKESNLLVILSRTRKKLRKLLEREGYII